MAKPGEERRIARTTALVSAVRSALSATYRVVRTEPSYAEVRARGGDPERRALYALNHGDLWLLIPYLQHEGVKVMVSEHRDGEIITRTLERVGFGAVRGSSTRGGVRALLEFVRVAREGDVDMAITVDGPRGPAEVVKPGIVLAASRSGLPIVPIAAAARRVWRARSWDRLAIAKPFASVAVGHGDEIVVPPDVPRDDLDAWCERVRRGIAETRAQVAAKAWGDPRAE